MKIALVAWVGHRAGMQCSISSSSLSTVPYSMKNPITCFQLSPNVQQSTTTPCILLKKWGFTLYSAQEMITCCSQLHCIGFNVPGTNFSIKQVRGKKHDAKEPNQIKSNPKRFRYDRTGCCLSSPSSRG